MLGGYKTLKAGDQCKFRPLQVLRPSAVLRLLRSSLETPSQQGKLSVGNRFPAAFALNLASEGKTLSLIQKKKRGQHGWQGKVQERTALPRPIRGSSLCSTGGWKRMAKTPRFPFDQLGEKPEESGGWASPGTAGLHRREGLSPRLNRA